MAKVKKTTKPTTTPDEKKRGATKRPVHPNVNDDAKLTELPPDFDFDKHASIKRKCWLRDDLFFDYKGAELDFRADQYRAKAEEARKLGTGAQRAKARRLISMTEKMAELKAQLEEQGIDVDEMLSNVT